MNRFERHGKITLIIFLICVCAVLDLGIGSIVLPKGFPTINRQENPFFNHTLAPNFDGTDEWTAGTYRLTTNSLGFKDKVVRDVSSTTDRHRIVFIGDSFTEGIGLQFDKTFVGRIADKLDPQGYEILNAGVVSYSPYIYYLKTKYLIEHGLKFDELVVFIDMSDVQDEITYQPWTPSDPSWIERTWNAFYKKADFFLEHHSLVYLHGIRPITFGVYTKRLRTLFLGGSGDGEKVSDKDKKYLADRGRWAFDDEVYNDWGKKGVALELAHMQDLIDLCKKNSIKVSIAVYPWPDNILAQDIQSRQVSIWKKFSDVNSLTFYNLFPVFMNTSMKSSEVVATYFLPHNDVHWNAAGHQLVADAWLEHFLSHQH